MKILLCILMTYFVLFAGTNNYIFTPLLKELPYNKAKARLGRTIFSDKRLGPDKKISCDKCHNLEVTVTGTSDKTTPNPPTLLNVYMDSIFSNSGTIKNLKEQIKKSLFSTSELNSSQRFIISQMVKNPYYVTEFKSIYKSSITIDNIVDSLNEFMKALITPNSSFDRFLAGDDQALNKDQKEGLEIFIKSGCISCHSGINLGGNLISVMNNEITGTDEFLKVPTLRNISLTQPYFHDGRAKNLMDALDIIELDDQDSIENTRKIYIFLKTLVGQTPEILNE